MKRTEGWVERSFVIVADKIRYDKMLRINNKVETCHSGWSCGEIPLSSFLILSPLPAHCLSLHYFIHRPLGSRTQERVRVRACRLLGKEQRQQQQSCAQGGQAEGTRRVQERSGAGQHGGDLQGVEYVISCHVMLYYAMLCYETR